MCGKDLYFALFVFGTLGSPPHVRERRVDDKHIFSKIGITPARAGKTPR